MALLGILLGALEKRYAPKIERRILFDNSRKLTNALIEGNNWILSHEKSGTTFLCNMIACRNLAFSGNITAFNMDQIYKGGVFRSVSDASKTVMDLAAFAQSNAFGCPVFVHTHEAFPAEFKKSIMLSRNLFDQLISSYNFLYARRSSRQNVAFNDILEKMVRRYCRLLNFQLETLSARSTDALLIRYEDLMREPVKSYQMIFRFLELQTSDSVIEKCLERTSPAAVKTHESQTGKALVAGSNYEASSFIRSGEIGEHNAALSTVHKEKIHSIVDEYQFTRNTLEKIVFCL